MAKCKVIETDPLYLLRTRFGVSRVVCERPATPPTRLLLYSECFVRASQWQHRVEQITSTVFQVFGIKLHRNRTFAEGHQSTVASNQLRCKAIQPEFKKVNHVRSGRITLVVEL